MQYSGSPHRPENEIFGLKKDRDPDLNPINRIFCTKTDRRGGTGARNRNAILRVGTDTLEPDAKKPYFFDRFGSGGTFLPARRASLKPIAIACFGFVTFWPLPPLRSVPAFISRISRPTWAPAAGEYLRPLPFFAGAFAGDFFTEDFFADVFFAGAFAETFFAELFFAATFRDAAPVAFVLADFVGRFPAAAFFVAIRVLLQDTPADT